MKEYQKPGSAACIDEKLKEKPVVNPDELKVLRDWNILRDYTHSLYNARNPKTVKEDYRDNS